MDLAHSHFVAGVAFFCHCHFDLRAARGSAKKLKNYQADPPIHVGDQDATLRPWIPVVFLTARGST